MTMHAIMHMGPVFPVVVIKHVSQAMPLAHALADGGINVIEITLYSDAALDCIAAIAGQRPQMTVGAGTVLTPAQMQAVALPPADAVFYPTGGISAETAVDWLALSNIACVGGTWVALAICLLPAILPPSPPAQKPASVCLADHSRSRNSTHIGAELA